MPKSINALNSDLFGSGDAERVSDPKAARKKAMDFLARREYGRDELVGRLLAANFEIEEAAAAVDELAADGLQDDRRFVQSFVAARSNRGSGPLRIRQALRERGIHSVLIDDVLQSVDTDWLEQAANVLVKKFGRELPVDFKEKARQMRFLQYRGFDMDQIQYAMRSTRD